MAKRKKPKISFAAFSLLAEIDGYIRRYNIRGNGLVHAASDVCDGGYTTCELHELVDNKLLRPIDFHTGRRIDMMQHVCGDCWTVELTRRAMKLFWPDRVVSQSGM